MSSAAVTVTFDGARVRMARDVGERLAQHCDQAVGDFFAGERVDRARELDRRLEAERGRGVGDDVEHLAPQAAADLRHATRG